MPSTLSPRETEILALVADGLTSKAIAARLGISESTVNWHLANALKKLGVASRAAAVATAIREGPLAAAPAQITKAHALERWHVMLAAVMTLMFATPLVIAAAWLAVRDPATAPTPTEAPTRSAAASSAPPARATSTMVPAVSTPPPPSTPRTAAGPLPGPVPVAPGSAVPTATATYPPIAPLATPVTPLPLVTPALATPAVPLPTPTLTQSVPALPSVPELPSVPTLPSVP